MSDKAIFLDRDDTLIDDPGYINHPEQVKLLDGVPSALIQFKKLGYKLIVVTNQSGVAHGIVTEKVLGEIHERLEQLLAHKNAYLDRIYYCPYHPDGVVQKYRKESNCRKPNPGMLLKAAKEMDIDLEQSWCIGNSSRDIEAGRQAGCKTILIDMPPSHQRQPVSSMSPAGTSPDYKAVNIKEAVNIVKKYLRTSTGEQKQARPVTTNRTEPVSEASEPVSELDESPAQFEAEHSAPEPREPDVQNAEPETQPKDPQPVGRKTQRTRQEIPADRTEELLSGILGQLKSMQRAEMFGEFSVMRLLAGIMQILVLFCLLVTVWFLMSPEKQDSSVFIALGFAVVLQLMTLTFYIMQGKK